MERMDARNSVGRYEQSIKQGDATMKETRPCLVTCHEIKWKGDTRHKVAVPKNAIFHRFADGVTTANDVEVPYTYALVEFENGKLEKVNPDLVKFTDTKKESRLAVAAA
jgi:hypothetical protein